MHVGYWWESQKARPSGKRSCRWVENIEMDFGLIGLSSMYWIDLAED
jgi:hypothetical protein